MSNQSKKDTWDEKCPTEKDTERIVDAPEGMRNCTVCGRWLQMGEYCNQEQTE